MYEALQLLSPSHVSGAWHFDAWRILFKFIISFHIPFQSLPNHFPPTLKCLCFQNQYKICQWYLRYFKNFQCVCVFFWLRGGGASVVYEHCLFSDLSSWPFQCQVRTDMFFLIHFIPVVYHLVLYKCNTCAELLMVSMCTTCPVFFFHAPCFCVL